MSTSADTRGTRAGFLSAFAAYTLWGTSPLFFALLKEVPAWEVVSHRVVWGLVAIAAVLPFVGHWHEVLRILRNRHALLVFVGSALMITANWVTFVWAVGHGFTLEASLGYYLLPLVSVMLGAVFLKERFTRRQGAALLLVIAGVGSLLVGLGTVPWVALTLAFSFSTYGLLRKIAPAESLIGLFVETLLLLPVALACLAVMEVQGTAVVVQAGRLDLWLLLVVGTPFFTAFPLFLFAFGARRLRLSTTGLMFYINPTIQFLIAVFVFREPMTTAHTIAFGCIWAGIALYMWPRRARSAGPPEPAAAPQAQEPGEP